MVNSPLEQAQPAETAAEPELRLLLEWPEEHTRGEWFAIIAGTIGIHLVLFILAVQVSSFRSPFEAEKRVVVVKRTPLYLPPDVLTQKAPNKAKLTKQIDLASLASTVQARTVRPSPGASQRRVERPQPTPQLAKAPPLRNEPKILPEPPKIALSPNTPVLPPGSQIAALPPPPPPQSAPSSPFENVGSEAPPTNIKPTIRPPAGSTQAIVQNLAREPVSKHVSITDDSQSSPRPGAAGSTGQFGNQHSGVELKSDPQGADLRPYLAEILSIVRANWRRVMPESAVLGKLRGRTVIEFALDRNGRVVKLVIGDGSGSTSLDTASVAGLSMSNPLPPLPADFKGMELRLAFTFAYNMAAQ